MLFVSLSIFNRKRWPVKREQQTIFLFGAGISRSIKNFRENNFPLNEDILYEIFTANVFKDTNERFKYLCGNYSKADNIVTPFWIRKLLSLTMTICSENNVQVSNYEQLSYICQSLSDHQQEEYENPALQPFLIELRKRYVELTRIVQSTHENLKKQNWEDFNPLASLRFLPNSTAIKNIGSPKALEYVKFIENEPDTSDSVRLKQLIVDLDTEFTELYTLDKFNTSFEEILKSCSLFIADIVLENLRTRENPDLKSFNSFCSSLKLTDSTQIFTLNNDTLLEEAFKITKIDYYSGFENTSWKGFSNSKNNSRVILYKLHGSINWQIVKGRLSSDHVSREHTAQPVFLVGTPDKFYSYLNDPHFFELQNCFKTELDKSQKLIISGYSFNDKAINTRIAQWMRKDASKVLLITPNEQAAIDGARRAIRNNVNVWKQQKKFVVFESKFEEAPWEKILTQEICPDFWSDEVLSESTDVSDLLESI